MKCKLRTIKEGDITYDALLFVCPGCVAAGPEGYAGLHLLAVNADDVGKTPSWEWNGDLQAPTLSPSILTNHGVGGVRCHSYLRDGVFEFLSDSTHPLSGQSVPMPDLPDWASELSDDDQS